MDGDLYEKGKDGKGLLLHELLEELENNEEITVSSIGINPPFEEDGIDSCEDSDASDIEASCNINHLPSRILLSECITNQSSSSKNTIFDNNVKPSTSKVRSSSESEDNIPLARLVSKRKKKTTTTNKKTSKSINVTQERVWMEQEPIFNIPKFQPSYPTTEEFLKNTLAKPIDAFFSFFTDKFVRLIVAQTNLYAGQKGNHNLHVTENEIKVVVGILLFSGYHTLPGRRMYWKGDADCYCPLIADAIRRNRFDDILRYLHFADNTALAEADRFYKVRPIFDNLNDTFKQFSTEENYIDESMIPYYGRHGAKQFIRGKPIRVGFKLWCLANPTGFLHHVEPYCGSSTRLPDTPYGQGGNVVLGLAQHAELPKGTKLFFDNLFTSVALLDELTSLGYGGTGTLRQNRVPKKANLSDNKSFAKSNRGSMELKTDEKLLLVRCVNMSSTSSTSLS